MKLNIYFLYPEEPQKHHYLGLIIAVAQLCKILRNDQYYFPRKRDRLKPVTYDNIRNVICFLHLVYPFFVEYRARGKC